MNPAAAVHSHTTRHSPLVSMWVREVLCAIGHELTILSDPIKAGLQGIILATVPPPVNKDPSVGSPLSHSAVGAHSSMHVQLTHIRILWSSFIVA